MAQGNNNNDDRNEVVSSKSLTPDLPTLPFDVLPEILCRLPVKLLVQLRCLCKSFNSLISDPKFSMKHLQLSTKRRHLMLTNQLAYDSPIPSVFSTSTVFTETQLYPPIKLKFKFVFMLCSCDGILFCKFDIDSYFLWNPSIRKFKLLPPLDNPLQHFPFYISFGYDHFIDKYKVISVSSKNEVFVYTLGTDYWTTIEEDIPYRYRICGKGVFLSGTVSWPARDRSNNSLYFILSLDLRNESYHKLYLPDFKNDPYSWKLDVVRDCLCVFEISDMFFNVWIMKEYGKKESWTKLYTIPNLQDQDLEADTALYISEDDQLLVECYEMSGSGNMKLVVYNSKTGTSNIPEFQNNYEYTKAKVYVESLISP